MARKANAATGKGTGRRRSFYASVLDQADALELEEALDVEGVSDEIALLRVKIQSLLENDPDNVKLLLDATNALARLVKTRYSLEKEQGKGLKEAIGNVLKDIALPLGVGIGAALNK
ncbi:MAG: hypothetical protein SVP26_08820 [Chloroflexota bacterium]|nr:hypothetical protein [Chloroflexota bacterium]